MYLQFSFQHVCKTYHLIYSCLEHQNCFICICRHFSLYILQQLQVLELQDREFNISTNRCDTLYMPKHTIFLPGFLKVISSPKTLNLTCCY